MFHPFVLAAIVKLTGYQDPENQQQQRASPTNGTKSFNIVPPPPDLHRYPRWIVEWWSIPSSGISSAHTPERFVVGATDGERAQPVRCPRRLTSID